MSVFWLKLRMWLLVAILFSIVYGLVVMVAAHLGIVNFWTYLLIALVMMFIQYMVGPKLIEWQMRIRYVSDKEEAELYSMVKELADHARIPMPRIGIADIGIPNAFAFGRWKSDGRVCVTRGIMNLLSEDELRAVLAHELSHLKNRDVLTITLLSVIPLVLYHIAVSNLYYRRPAQRRGEGNSAALIGMAAMLFYFITNLLVLYGSMRVDKESLRQVEGLKAFFVNDPSCALNEIKELRQLDLDKSGTIDTDELAVLSSKRLNIGFAERLLEVMSTHPNMLKRIKMLSSYNKIAS